MAPERTMERSRVKDRTQRLERRQKTAGKRVIGAEEARSRCQE